MRLHRCLLVMERLMRGRRDISGVARELDTSYSKVLTTIEILEDARLVEQDGPVHSMGERRMYSARSWRLTYRGRRMVKAWHS